ncbi:MAG: PCRF domain-containing protein [Tepidisphaeraceae bacterium]
MIEKLEEISNRFEEVGQLLSQPDVVRDVKKFAQLSKEYRDLEKVVLKYKDYKAILDGLQHAREVLETEKDPSCVSLPKWNSMNWLQNVMPWRQRSKSS